MTRARQRSRTSRSADDDTSCSRDQRCRVTTCSTKGIIDPDAARRTSIHCLDAIRGFGQRYKKPTGQSRSRSADDDLSSWRDGRYKTTTSTPRKGTAISTPLCGRRFVVSSNPRVYRMSKEGTSKEDAALRALIRRLKPYGVLDDIPTMHRRSRCRSADENISLPRDQNHEHCPGDLEAALRASIRRLATIIEIVRLAQRDQTLVLKHAGVAMFDKTS